jgi:hypothetical protein
LNTCVAANRRWRGRRRRRRRRGRRRIKRRRRRKGLVRERKTGMYHRTNGQISSDQWVDRGCKKLQCRKWQRERTERADGEKKSKKRKKGSSETKRKGEEMNASSLHRQRWW